MEVIIISLPQKVRLEHFPVLATSDAAFKICFLVQERTLRMLFLALKPVNVWSSESRSDHFSGPVPVLLKSSQKAAHSGLCSLDAHGNVGEAAPTYTERVQIPSPAPLKMEDGGQEGDEGTPLLFLHPYPSLSSSWTSLTAPSPVSHVPSSSGSPAPLSCISWDLSPSSLSEGQRAPRRLRLSAVQLLIGRFFWKHQKFDVS